MYILNPRYEIEQTSWFWKIFGWKWQVLFRYAVELENENLRYSAVRYMSRGRFETIRFAENRMRELNESPEWAKQ